MNFNNKAIILIFEFVFLVVLGSDVWAHARLKANANIQPRSNSTGEKVGPCGPAPRIAIPKVVAADSTITVEWEETVNHPGRYEFYLSRAADANFVFLKTVIDNQDTGIVAGNFHQYSTTITFPPGVTCETCTLQMRQIMTDQNNSEYYSCSDLKLVGPTSTTPTPPSDPNCAK